MLTPQERAVVRETTIATIEKAIESVQAILSASDGDAASKGNLWWQGRISGLSSAEAALCALLPVEETT